MFNMAANNLCSCTGIRSCILCENYTLTVKEKHILTKESEDNEILKFFLCLTCKEVVPREKECSHNTSGQNSKLISGINVIQDFINEEEERRVVDVIDQTYWKTSQSGRRKQDYGPQVNFKRKKVKQTYFNGLPAFSRVLVERMWHTVPALNDFKVVELCNLEYVPERGAAIDPHFDDFWLWGERLVTINLLSSTIMTMSNDKIKTEVDFEMPRRSLVLITGPARYEWKHAIKSKNIKMRRIAITFRELSSEFSTGEPGESLGRQILETALSFNGNSVQENMGLN